MAERDDESPGDALLERRAPPDTESDANAEFRATLRGVVAMHTRLTDQLRVLTPYTERALAIEEEKLRLQAQAARREEHRLHREDTEFTESMIRRRSREERFMAFIAELGRFAVRLALGLGEFLEHPMVRYGLISVILAALTWASFQLRACTPPTDIVSLPPTTIQEPAMPTPPVNKPFMLRAIADGRADNALHVTAEEWEAAKRAAAPANITPLPAPAPTPRRTASVEAPVAVVPRRRLVTA